MAVRERVCVTGAGGYVASWLVKLLLSKGYMVHGTVRDPSDEKNAHLKKLDKAAENLQLFKADLLDYDALSAAIAGCEGVFHVASPVTLSKVPNPEVEIITPAVTGTINVLKACSEAKVKRAVVVSSTAAVTFNPNWPHDRVMDEDCWSDKEFCRTTEGDVSRQNKIWDFVDIRDVADAVLLAYEKYARSIWTIHLLHSSNLDPRHG